MEAGKEGGKCEGVRECVWWWWWWWWDMESWRRSRLVDQVTAGEDKPTAGGEEKIHGKTKMGSESKTL